MIDCLKVNIAEESPLNKSKITSGLAQKDCNSYHLSICSMEAHSYIF